MTKFKTCLWFDHQAEEAATFYTKLFPQSQIVSRARYGEAGAQVSGRKAGSVMTVEFELSGQAIVGLNGGPLFKFNPSQSFFVWCETEAEITKLWQQLSAGGALRMGLDKYPWAAKYGWTADQFGVEWQLILSPRPKKMAPAFLFVGDHFGKGEEAINFYLSQFPNSQVQLMAKDEKSHTILHCIFSLNGQDFVLMEGAGDHPHQFTPAFSQMVLCDTQSEIDQLWTSLVAGGGAHSRCGWLTDKYGVSWQIVPRVLAKLVSDPHKTEQVMQAVLQMTKLDIQALLAAHAK